MKKKLILLFDKDSEIAGFETAYVFCNEKDAKAFLLSHECFLNVNLCPDDNYFSFELLRWSGTGKCFWATDKT